VRGYKEKGSINTPMDLAICNQIDRFSIAMDVIDRISKLKVAGAHVKEMLKDEQISCRAYAFEHGIDRPDVVDWKLPY
jgi:xylulose-5-phosphate/fructose-6-phosphate phosphoketolase